MWISGCAWIDEVGKDKSYASLEATSESSGLDEKLQCVYETLPIEFWEFDADEPYPGMVRLHFYESLSKQDSVFKNYMEIRFLRMDVENQQRCPEIETYEGATFDVTPHGCVQAEFQVNSCEDAQTTAKFVGTMTLDKLSTARRGEISGTMEGKLVYYEVIRTTTYSTEMATEVASVSGKFSFVNHAGAVWFR